MNLKILTDIPPWDWPEGTDKALLDILRNDGAAEPDLLLATQLAGDFTVINDDLADALLSILRSSGRPAEVRGRAAISLGPALEDADTQGFEDFDDSPITERTFRKIQETLHTLYVDAGVPGDVRRRILEASVRAQQDWHWNAVRAAYASADESWRLTAVFCMRFVRGFDDQILEALDSNDEDMRHEAVCAAGNWAVAGAWPTVVALATSSGTPKRLLLAAIEALASIRPHEAIAILDDLAESDDEQDEEIGTAIDEARVMAAGASDAGEDEEPDDDDEFI